MKAQKEGQVEMSSVIARAKMNAQKKPIYDTNRSHQAMWREQTKQKGDMVKLKVVLSFIELRKMLLLEYDQIKERIQEAEQQH